MDNMFDSEFTAELKADYTQSAIDGFNFSVDNFGIDILVNSDLTKRVLLKNKSIGNEKEISAKIGDIQIGDIIEFNNQKWIVTDIPSENDIYLKAIIKRCNTTFTIRHMRDKIFKGYDNDGRPINVDTFFENEEPCIVSTTYSTGKENEQIPLPDGAINIIIKYQEADNIKVNSNFKIYNQNYEIQDIDFTKVMDGIGIMIIRGKREVRK